MFGKIERLAKPPTSLIPMRAADGTSASHDTCATPLEIKAPFVTLRVPERQRPVNA